MANRRGKGGSSDRFPLLGLSNHCGWWLPKNWCLWTVVLEKTPESSLDSREIKPVNLKGELIWRTDAEAETSSILVIWCEQPTHWRSPWCWERLRTEEEGIRRWDGWLASPMQWANFGRWGGTGMPGVLQSLRSQRVRHDWVTEQQQLYSI